MGEYDPALHSSHGVVGVNLPGFPQGIDDRIIETTKQLPEFPFVQDMNSGDIIGIGNSSLFRLTSLADTLG